MVIVFDKTITFDVETFYPKKNQRQFVAMETDRFNIAPVIFRQPLN